LPVTGQRLEAEEAVEGADRLRQADQQATEPGRGAAGGGERAAELYVHVGLLQQEIALDEQLLGRARLEAAAQSLHRFAQDVVVQVQRMEGDVGGDDDRRSAGRIEQRL